MRPLSVSLLALAAASAFPMIAQTQPAPSSSSSTNASGGTVQAPQIPFGQTYKDFEYPVYQNGQLMYKLLAVSAKGITVNRADAKQLLINIYTNDKITTTITSPDADLYVADRKMRTRNTVKVDRADLVATSQVCDFDLDTKKYLMRENVKVILKNFDVGGAAKAPSSKDAPGKPGTAKSGSPIAATRPIPEPLPTASPHDGGLLEVPGAYSSTNTAPIPPPTPVSP